METETVMVTYGGNEYRFEDLSEEQKQQVVSSSQARQVISTMRDIANVIQNLPVLATLAERGVESADIENAKTFPPPAQPNAIQPEPQVMEPEEIIQQEESEQERTKNVETKH